MRDRQNERTRKWNSVRGFAFGVPALLCKAFDDFVYPSHSCTVPIGNEEMQRRPPNSPKTEMSNGVLLLVFPRPNEQTLGAWRGPGLAKSKLQSYWASLLPSLSICLYVLRFAEDEWWWEQSNAEDVCPRKGKCTHGMYPWTEDVPMKGTNYVYLCENMVYCIWRRFWCSSFALQGFHQIMDHHSIRRLL